MTIEKLIEDIETQAFFAQLDRKTPKSQKILSAIITLRTADKQSMNLTSPVVGEDFIAGFTLNRCQPAWAIAALQAVCIIRVQSVDQDFLESEYNLEKLIGAKLLDVPVEISLQSGIARRGKIRKIRSELFLFNSKTNFEWIPICSLEYLIVENLSNLT